MDIKEVTIILKGSWNRKLFTPSWVMNNLFELQDGEELEVGIDDSDLKAVYRIKGVTFIPSDSLIEFKVEDEITDDKLIFCVEKAIKLVELLPHTPNVIVGINYRYPKSYLIDSTLKKPLLKGFTNSQIIVKQDQEGVILNVLIDTNSTIFNYHYKKKGTLKKSDIIDNLKNSEALWKQMS